MRKFKIGIMGGDRGRFVLLCEPLLSDQMEVTALLETSDAILKSLKDDNLLNDNLKLYTDFDEFIHSGIDAVVLCNYFYEHSEYAIKALNANVAVLSETTAAPSLGDCVKLVEAVENTKGKYMLGANCVYFRAVQAMKKCIDEQKYGAVVYADGEYVHPLDPDVVISGTVAKVDKENLHWRNTLPRCYYNMHDLGPLMYITGAYPKKVIGKAVVTKNPIKELINYDKCYSLVEMDDGSVINYTGLVSAGALGKWYRIGCKYGTVESVRFNADEDKIIENAHKEPITRELGWSESGAMSVEEEKLYKFDDPALVKRTHSGVDLVLLLNFLKYLRNEEEPFFDVYRSVALSATGIIAWYSMLSDSKQLEIPDFRKKEDREKYRNDFRMPFAKKLSDVTLPYSINGDVEFNL